MKKYLSLSLSVVAISLISWGTAGHRTVARIAENHLSNKAKVSIQQFLGGVSLVDISNYADEIKADPRYRYTSPWHYVNLPLGLSFSEFSRQAQSLRKPNAYSALLRCENVLKSKSLTKEQKVFALKLMVHLVGDMHQPMHISRAEDKGGNTTQVRFDGKGTNLHALWDSGLIGYQNLSYIEMAKNYDTATSKQIKQWQNDDVLKWLFESYQISSQLYAEINENNKLDEYYYNKYIPIVEQRIEKGGIRLAGLLNDIFKNASDSSYSENKFGN